MAYSQPPARKSRVCTHVRQSVQVVAPGFVALPRNSNSEEYCGGTSSARSTLFSGSVISSVVTSLLALSVDSSVELSPLLEFNSRATGRGTKHSASSSETKAFNNAQWISTINSHGKSISWYCSASMKSSNVNKSKCSDSPKTLRNVHADATSPRNPLTH